MGVWSKRVAFVIFAVLGFGACGSDRVAKTEVVAACTSLRRAFADPSTAAGPVGSLAIAQANAEVAVQKDQGTMPLLVAVRRFIYAVERRADGEVSVAASELTAMCGLEGVPLQTPG